MAINTTGLPLVTGNRTLTSGVAPIALGNEVRGGIHRISGQSGDELADIRGTHLQVGMLVYNEMTSQYFMYRNVGTAPASPPDANDPFRNAAGELPNNVGTIGADDSNWLEFQLSPERLSDVGNVRVTNPEKGQYITYDDADGGIWQNVTFNEALSNLTDVADTFSNLMDGDRLVYRTDSMGDGSNVARWLNEGNHVPAFPTNQLDIQVPNFDPNNPEFVPQNFLYEIRVDANADGTRTATWMEAPGTVRLDLESTPNVPDGQVAFRRGPSDFVRIGFAEQQIRTAEAFDNSTSQVIQGLGPLIWGEPLRGGFSTTFGTQPTLWIFGNNDTATWLDSTPPVTSGNFVDLAGTIIHLNLDYDGVTVNLSDSRTTKTPTQTLAVDEPNLAALREALPAGQYTGEVAVGRSYFAGDPVLNGFFVGFTELRDQDGILHRIPQPPVQTLIFGAANPTRTAGPATATQTQVRDVRSADETNVDPILFFEHGGVVDRTRFAGGEFISSTRIEGTGSDPDQLVTALDAIPGIRATDSAGDTVINSDNTGNRNNDTFRNTFPTVTAGTGIELRSDNPNELQIVNTFQETNQDTVHSRVVQSIERTVIGDALVDEYWRGETPYIVDPIANRFDSRDRAITFNPEANESARLSFSFITGLIGANNPYSVGDVVIFEVVNAISGINIPVDRYTGVVQSAPDVPDAGPGTLEVTWPVTLHQIRTAGGFPLADPASNETATGQVRGDITIIASVTHVAADNNDPFIMLEHSSPAVEDTYVRLIGGSNVSVTRDDSSSINIASTDTVGVNIEDNANPEGANIRTINFGTGLDVEVVSNVATITADAMPVSGGGIDEWQQNMAYDAGDVFYTTDNARYPLDFQNDIFRVSVGIPNTESTFSALIQARIVAIPSAETIVRGINNLPNDGNHIIDSDHLPVTTTINAPDTRNDVVPTAGAVRTAINSAPDIRVQATRLEGSTLRFYYGTDESGPGDFFEDLSSLQNIPVRSYADIAARNADTTITEAVFAAVENDTGDGQGGQGNAATYILRTLPTAGQPTTNANWARVSSPDTILNEVPGCQWRPYLEADMMTPSRNPADSSRPNPNADAQGYIVTELGEISDDTRTIGDARYLRIDTGNAVQNGIAEAQRSQARSNLGIVEGHGSPDYAARLFSTSGFYEAGDIVTQERSGFTGTNPNRFRTWVLSIAELDGRTTAIPAARSPGGADGIWIEITDNPYYGTGFDATNGRYGPGDVVTTVDTTTTPDTYTTWVARAGVAATDTTPISAANSPGGANNNWQEVNTDTDVAKGWFFTHNLPATLGELVADQEYTLTVVTGDATDVAGGVQIFVAGFGSSVPLGNTAVTTGGNQEITFSFDTDRRDAIVEGGGRLPTDTLIAMVRVGGSGGTFYPTYRTLTETSVVNGSYQNANITVDPFGRVTHATDGHSIVPTAAEILDQLSVDTYVRDTGANTSITYANFAPGTFEYHFDVAEADRHVEFIINNVPSGFTIRKGEHWIVYAVETPGANDDPVAAIIITNTFTLSSGHISVFGRPVNFGNVDSFALWRSLVSGSSNVITDNSGTGNISDIGGNNGSFYRATPSHSRGLVDVAVDGEVSLTLDPVLNTVTVGDLTKDSFTTNDSITAGALLYTATNIGVALTPNDDEFVYGVGNMGLPAGIVAGTDYVVCISVIGENGDQLETGDYVATARSTSQFPQFVAFDNIRTLNDDGSVSGTALDFATLITGITATFTVHTLVTTTGVTFNRLRQNAANQNVWTIPVTGADARQVNFTALPRVAGEDIATQSWVESQDFGVDLSNFVNDSIGVGGISTTAVYNEATDRTTINIPTTGFNTAYRDLVRPTALLGLSNLGPYHRVIQASLTDGTGTVIVDGDASNFASNTGFHVAIDIAHTRTEYFQGGALGFQPIHRIFFPDNNTIQFQDGQGNTRNLAGVPPIIGSGGQQLHVNNGALEYFTPTDLGPDVTTNRTNIARNLNSIDLLRHEVSQIEQNGGHFNTNPGHSWHYYTPIANSDAANRYRENNTAFTAVIQRGHRVFDATLDQFIRDAGASAQINNATFMVVSAYDAAENGNHIATWQVEFDNEWVLVDSAPQGIRYDGIVGLVAQGFTTRQTPRSYNPGLASDEVAFFPETAAELNAIRNAFTQGIERIIYTMDDGTTVNRVISSISANVTEEGATYARINIGAARGSVGVNTAMTVLTPGSIFGSSIVLTSPNGQQTSTIALDNTGALRITGANVVVAQDFRSDPTPGT